MIHNEDILTTVRALKYDRRSNKHIARALGVTEGTIESLCYKHRIKRRSIASVHLGRPLYTELTLAASKRSEKTEEFIRKVLWTVVHSNLFTAILDDGK